MPILVLVSGSERFGCFLAVISPTISSQRSYLILNLFRLPCEYDNINKFYVWRQPTGINIKLKRFIYSDHTPRNQCPHWSELSVTYRLQDQDGRAILVRIVCNIKTKEYYWSKSLTDSGRGGGGGRLDQMRI